MNYWQVFQSLRQKGILGINARNVAYIARYNERAHFPLVDNKLLTKQTAEKNGIATPQLYGVIRRVADLRKLGDLLEPLNGFVVKPARGSGGKGIIVISGRHDRDFLKPSGATLKLHHLRHDISNILSGVYSLGGRPDIAFIESLVTGAPYLQQYSHGGLPDIRLIVFKGFPLMGMMRCPTTASDGKANLHQGAVGVGLDICSGTALQAVQHNRLVNAHPDSGIPFADLQVPQWRALLNLAARCYDVTGLGYMGCDIVLDAQRGPLILELNARPGLTVQIANGIGLRSRLRTIEALEHSDFHAEARVQFVLQTFSSPPTTGL